MNPLWDYNTDANGFVPRKQIAENTLKLLYKKV